MQSGQHRIRCEHCHKDVTVWKRPGARTVPCPNCGEPIDLERGSELKAGEEPPRFGISLKNRLLQPPLSPKPFPKNRFLSHRSCQTPKTPRPLSVRQNSFQKKRPPPPLLPKQNPSGDLNRPLWMPLLQPLQEPGQANGKKRKSWNSL